MGYVSSQEGMFFHVFPLEVQDDQTSRGWSVFRINQCKGFPMALLVASRFPFLPELLNPRLRDVFAAQRFVGMNRKHVNICLKMMVQVKSSNHVQIHQDVSEREFSPLKIREHFV